MLYHIFWSWSIVFCLMIDREKYDYEDIKNKKNRDFPKPRFRCLIFKDKKDENCRPKPYMSFYFFPSERVALAVAAHNYPLSY